MDRLFVIADSEECSRDIGGKLAGGFDTRPFDLRNVLQAEPSKHVIFDIDLEDDTHVVALRHWLECRPKNGKVLFAVELLNKEFGGRSFKLTRLGPPMS